VKKNLEKEEVKKILLFQKFYQNLKTPKLKLPTGKPPIYKLQLSV